MNKVLSIIMAGGEGTRLLVLSNRRAKPAVPFGGIYRIIDFTLSNVMHSGGRNVGVIMQYRPYSLADHIGQGESWGLFGFDRKVKVLSPYLGDGQTSFFRGTADAIYRNIEFIERFPEITEVLILSGDHIYSMDYRPMLSFHRDHKASLTIATQPVPWEETSRFGIMVSDDGNRITQFQEKPKSNPLSNQASLGIYIFSKDCLLNALREDQEDPQSKHDFGGNIIPKLIETVPSFNYEFKGYWRDVGTIRSYVDTSMEILDPDSGLALREWDVRTNHRQIQLKNQYPSYIGAEARVERSLVSKGARVEGTVENSILSPGVIVGRGARVRNSILLHNVTVGEGCRIDNVIMDKGSSVGDNTWLGDPDQGDEANERVPHLLGDGVSVFGQGSSVCGGIRIGVNALIYPRVNVTRKPGDMVRAGRTFLSDED